MRHIKTPADLRQWRKEHNGLTHIGQYKDMPRFIADLYREWHKANATGAADYERVERDEFLRDGK